MTTPARLADLIETANEDEIAILEKALRQVRSAKANLGAIGEALSKNFWSKRTLPQKPAHRATTRRN